MPTETIGANLGHQRIAGASAGVSLSTTSAFTPFHRGTEHIDIVPRNFSTAVVVQYAFCPYLVVLKADSADGLGGHLQDNSDVAQDGSTATSVDLSSFTSGRALYVGSAIPFRGAHIDVDGANSTGSTVITTSYWNGAEWVDTSDTDGTISGGISLAQDGAITWTVPSAWQISTLAKLASAAGESLDSSGQRYRDTNMYWTKWTWDQNMDAAVTLDHILGINESTAYAELTDSVAYEGRIHNGFGANGVAGIEALTNAGTANLIVTCSAMNGYFSTGKVL
jgi:hypothetical protein|tara:strand:- start:1376 stop:2215 length:840 start_codon:yes stop_codon:yes gene_type:complete